MPNSGPKCNWNFSSGPSGPWWATLAGMILDIILLYYHYTYYLNCAYYYIIILIIVPTSVAHHGPVAQNAFPGAPQGIFESGCILGRNSALYLGMKTKRDSGIEDRLFEHMPEHVRKLERQSRRERRLKDREAWWKKQNERRP